VDAGARDPGAPGDAAAAEPGPADPLDEFFFRADVEAPAAGTLPGAGAEQGEDAGVEEYLTFRLGAEEYGVSIGQVHEVLKAPAITEVPRAPAGILGVVTVRGEVVAVFDPRRRLNLPGAPPGPGEGRIVIVNDGGGPCGLFVDAVASVVRLPRRAVEPCPQGIGGASADCLAGIGRERGRLFTLLDLPALLRRAPAPEREGRARGAP
jgi:purine-binding chemotaxis protein CheW